MNDKTIGRVLIFFLLIVAVCITVAVSAVRNINRSVASSDWVNHTHAVILETAALRSAVYVGDAALQSFAATGNPRAQVVSGEALSNIAEHLEIAKALTRSEPAEAEQVAQPETLINQRIDFMRGVLTAKQAGSAEAVRRALAADANGEASREILRKLERLKDDELALLSERDTASYLQA